MEKIRVYQVRVSRCCSSTGVSSEKKTLCRDFKTANSLVEDVLREFKAECLKKNVFILHQFSAERPFAFSPGFWKRIQFITLGDGDTFAQSFDVVLDDKTIMIK